MEITDENLQTLSNFLQQTLSPDPAVRKPGITQYFCLCKKYKDIISVYYQLLVFW
jgi:hypothetical protein